MEIIIWFKMRQPDLLVCFCFTMNIPGSNKVIPIRVKRDQSRILESSVINKILN
jgi:hypothetical protein